MNWPVFLLATLIAFVILGIGTLIWIKYHWDRLGEIAGDVWVKCSFVTIKIISGIMALIGSYGDPHQKEEWLPAVVLGVISVGIWELIEKIVDWRIKSQDRIDKNTIGLLRAQCESLTRLVSSIRYIVNEKSKRLRRQMVPDGTRSGLKILHAGLTPANQLNEVLQSMAGFFQEQLNPDQTGIVRNFRAGLYLEKKGVMQAVAWIDLNNLGGVTFSSYHMHEEAFMLSNEINPSQVVKCARIRQTVILEDCVEAEKSNEFAFFRPEQRNYLRSMMAYFLGNVCAPEGGEAKAVLSIDTDEPGFFKNSERSAIEFIVREFADRIKLELTLQALFNHKK